MKRTFWYACALLFLMTFPYGPLFPWSPVKPGFEHLALERADVYYRTGTTLDPGYRRLDEYIAASERFHHMTAPRRLCVVACSDWADFHRFLPQHRGNGVGAVTLATGTIIYVSPRLAERKLDTGEFLRHEISHATLNQNQSLWNAYRIANVPWLLEGLAVANGDQKSYYTDAEFFGRIGREDVGPFLDPARRGEAGPEFDIRYAYVAWRKFNEFLMAAKGRDRYQSYLQAVLRDPGSWRAAFSAAFGVTFDGAVAEFQAQACAARN